mmetsp:Transcript_5126/g.14328  ORF Transcript_5126/g.14328 Transcript_5126/m.14328 type:complete len:204 (+) Transcript_5126:310-921(+)
MPTSLIASLYDRSIVKSSRSAGRPATKEVTFSLVASVSLRSIFSLFKLWGRLRSRSFTFSSPDGKKDILKSKVSRQTSQRIASSNLPWTRDQSESLVAPQRPRRQNANAKLAQILLLSFTCVSCGATGSRKSLPAMVLRMCCLSPSSEVTADCTSKERPSSTRSRLKDFSRSVLAFKPAFAWPRSKRSSSSVRPAMMREGLGP